MFSPNRKPDPAVPGIGFSVLSQSPEFRDGTITNETSIND